MEGFLLFQSLLNTRHCSSEFIEKSMTNLAVAFQSLLNTRHCSSILITCLTKKTFPKVSILTQYKALFITEKSLQHFNGTSRRRLAFSRPDIPKRISGLFQPKEKHKEHKMIKIINRMLLLINKIILFFKRTEKVPNNYKELLIYLYAKQLAELNEYHDWQ